MERSERASLGYPGQNSSVRIPPARPARRAVEAAVTLGPRPEYASPRSTKGRGLDPDRARAEIVPELHDMRVRITNDDPQVNQAFEHQFVDWFLHRVSDELDGRLSDTIISAIPARWGLLSSVADPTVRADPAAWPTPRSERFARAEWRSLSPPRARSAGRRSRTAPCTSRGAQHDRSPEAPPTPCGPFPDPGRAAPAWRATAESGLSPPAARAPRLP